MGNSLKPILKSSLTVTKLSFFNFSNCTTQFTEASSIQAHNLQSKVGQVFFQAKLASNLESLWEGVCLVINLTIASVG